MLRKIVLFIIAFYILFSSLIINSVTYKFSFNKNRLTINALGIKINNLNVNSSKLNISFNPGERFSTNQYFIEKTNFLDSALNILRLLIFRVNPRYTIYKQSSNSLKEYIHFNPFRSSLVINDRYILEVNIPDASLEFWDGNNMQNFVIEPPWLKLIVSPVITSLSIAFLFYLLTTFLRGSVQSLKYKQNINFDVVNRSLPPVVFIIGTLSILYIFYSAFGMMPSFGDEMNYIMQAKIFASGNIFLKQPPMPEFFNIFWMDIFGSDGKLWDFHPPGNSIILMLGQLIGVDWITIPIVGGLILLVQYFLSLELFASKKIALIHVSLMLTSQYFLTLTGTYMAHAPSLLFISLFYLFIAKYLKKEMGIFLLFAGTSIGFAFAIRPVSAFLSAIIPLICLCIKFMKTKKIPIFSLTVSLLIIILISSGVFLYSYIISGKLTLPYLLKGPEVGETLSVRLAKGWEYRLTNLFRNANEFQNRVHSFGYLFNWLFFLYPIFSLKSNSKKWWILGSYCSFILYLTLQSFIHWYGWKWEPRMIYDISFLFFLLSSLGIWYFYSQIKNINFLKYLFILSAVGGFLFVVLFNLPYRLKSEYIPDYKSPSGVNDKVKKQRITNAIIFFTNDVDYAPYFVRNNITFNDRIIYALSQNEIDDYKLISRYPDKKIFYTYDGNNLVSKSNLSLNDITILKKYLRINLRNKEVTTVIPWLRVAADLYRDFPGYKIDTTEFFDLVIHSKLNTDAVYVLLGKSDHAISFLSHFYSLKRMRKASMKFPITYVEIKAKNTIKPSSVPLLKLSCYKGIDWRGEKIKEDLVTGIDLNDCYGPQHSAEWFTYFSLAAPRNITFYLNSDDVSQLIIDDKLILKTNQDGDQIQEISLAEGIHTLRLIYFNDPNGQYLDIGTIDDKGKKHKLSIESSNFTFYLPSEQWN